MAIRVRTEAGEEELELEEFEARVREGLIPPRTPVRWDLAGDRWLEARDLDVFQRLYAPRRLAFTAGFRLSRFPPVTFGLVLVCVAAYLWTLRTGGLALDSLVAHGAKAPPLVADLGQTWRLLAANFLHSGPLHLTFDLVVLFNAGGALENAYRRLDYLVIVAAAALGTTLASLAFADVVSDGASGIDYGLLAGVVVFGLRYRDILPARYRGVLGGLVPVVVACLYVGWTSTQVDNWGHAGGLLAGALATLAFKPRLLSDPPSPRALWLGRVAPLAAFLSLPLFAGPLLLRAGVLPRFERQVDERYGLSLPIPRGWRRGVDPGQRLKSEEIVFHNGLPGAERASLTLLLRELPEGAPPDLAKEASSFVADELVAERDSGRLSALVAGPPRPARLAGLPAMAVQAAVRTAEGRFHLAALIAARGRLLYTLAAVAPEQREAAYEPLFARIFERAELTDPAGLAAAKGRVLSDPFEPAAWAQLSMAYERVGETQRSADALARAVAQGRR